jgi:Zn finger protein HypA/HybF involved in hydrogenase expression
VHEWGLVADAIGELESRVPGSPPRKVTLALGPGADDDTVRAAWEKLTARGPLRSSVLQIEHEEDLLRCLDCGTDYHGRLPQRCPRCGGDGLVIERVADLAVRVPPSRGTALREPERSGAVRPGGDG